MMCEGGSPASCRMYSPRSVSTAATPAAAADPEQELARLFAAFRVEHLCAAPYGFRLEASEPRIQTCKRPVADRGALPSQRLEELRPELGHRCCAQRREPSGLELAQVRLQGRVRERLRRAGLEMHRLDAHQFSPARTSAT